MEQFLARISDDLMILDYAHQKKIDGRAFKQDILCAMRTIEPYSRILLAQNNCYRWIVVFCACLCAGKRLHILDGAEDLQKKAAPIEADLLIGQQGIVHGLLLLGQNKSLHGHSIGGLAFFDHQRLIIGGSVGVVPDGQTQHE